MTEDDFEEAVENLVDDVNESVAEAIEDMSLSQAIDAIEGVQSDLNSMIGALREDAERAAG